MNVWGDHPPGNGTRAESGCVCLPDPAGRPDHCAGLRRHGRRPGGQHRQHHGGGDSLWRNSFHERRTSLTGSGWSGRQPAPMTRSSTGSRWDLECSGMGTTLVAALAGPHETVILNEGDSRAYHVTPEGITRVTRDHSLVEDLVERGDLTREQARVHPHKNLITRALGAESRSSGGLFRSAGRCPATTCCCAATGLSNVVTDQEMLYEVIHGGEAVDLLRAAAGYRPEPGRAGQRDGGPDSVRITADKGGDLPWINT